MAKDSATALEEPVAGATETTHGTRDKVEESGCGSEYDPAVRRRRSVRLKEYDYAQAGACFVTICMYYRECLLGDVYYGEMRLNEYGIIARDEWLETAHVRPGVETDAFVIMPNHLHGIIVITDRRGVSPHAPNNAHPDDRAGVSLYAPTKGLRSPSQTIGAIVRGFKSASTKRINEIRNVSGAPVW